MGLKKETIDSLTAPVLVGGVGGSGTRIVTEILVRMGYFMGSNLNDSNDNMDIAEYFKYFRTILTNDISRETDASEKKLTTLLNSVQDTARKEIFSNAENSQKWGWKVPANYILLYLFLKKFPNLKYIHTIRHGLDMAYSKNQNQLRNWGSYFQINHEENKPEISSLKYWINANKYAVETGKKLLGDRFLLINFDKLCTDTSTEGKKIARFLNAENCIEGILMDSVQRPDTMGRYKQNGLSTFSKKDLESVAHLGFNLSF